MKRINLVKADVDVVDLASGITAVAVDEVGPTLAAKFQESLAFGLAQVVDEVLLDVCAATLHYGRDGYADALFVDDIIIAHVTVFYLAS